MDFVEPTQIEFGLTCLFVHEKYGAARFCIEYRKLNTVTIQESYLKPRMKECMDLLGDLRIFPTLDANSVYFQV